MMKYYLDADFIVHLENDGTMTPWEDADGFFSGWSDKRIESYRVVPYGSVWVRDDGEVFRGLMFAPAYPVDMEADDA